MKRKDFVRRAQRIGGTLKLIIQKQHRFVSWLRGILALALLTTLVAFNSSHAQYLRVFPQDVRFGDLQDIDYPYAKISGKVVRLSPGARIRDRDNRIVVPNELNEGGRVAYLLDPTGQLLGLWLLTPEEVAELAPPKSNSLWPW